MRSCTSSPVARRTSTRRRSRPCIPPGGGLPEGQILHLAGASADGWTIVAVHDSRESWEAFRDGTLMPAFQAGIEGGLPGPPDETAFEVETHETA